MLPSTVMNSEPSNPVIAIDPGTSKCGIAVLALDGTVIRKDIIARVELSAYVSNLVEETDTNVIVVGDSTQGKAVAEEISALPAVKIEMVDESYSTEKARDLFWTENKPQGIWRIFPPSFRPMPRPVDDYAAVIIGRRWLGIE